MKRIEGCLRHFGQGHRCLGVECRRSGLNAGQESRRQVFRADDVALAKSSRPFDGVFEFTHIPRPIVGTEDFHSVAGYLDRPAGPVIEFAFEEVCDQQRDIIPPLPQARQGNGDDVQAVIKVFAE